MNTAMVHQVASRVLEMTQTQIKTRCHVWRTIRSMKKATAALLTAMLKMQTPCPMISYFIAWM